MAQTSMSIQFDKSALARPSYPSTPRANPPLAELYPGNNLLFMRSSFPNALKRNRLYSAEFTFFYNVEWILQTIRYFDVSLNYSSDDFDPSTLTYDNRPAVHSLVTSTIKEEDGGQRTISSSSEVPRDRSYFASWFAGKTIEINTYPTTATTSRISSFQVFTQAAVDTSKAPVLSISYDDSVLVNYVVTGSIHTDGYADPHFSIYLAWGISRDDDYYCVADPIQTRATIRWRDVNSTAWNNIQLGSSQYYNIPAETWPDKTSVEWRVSVEDDLGVTRSSPIYTVSTTAARLVFVPKAPTDMLSVDETRPITFTWETRSTNETRTSGAELQWSTDGETWQALGSVGSNIRTYTVPAGTFPAAVIYWRGRAINVDGVAGDWATATFSTIDSPSVATPLNPVNQIENASDSIVFTWNADSSSGSDPTGADLQWSRDGATWVDLGSVSGLQQHYVVESGSLPTGRIFWRVRSYNRNGSAGPWSDAVSFIYYGAPGVPAVSATNTAYTTITWAADDQAAYRVTIDGTLFGPFFGTGKVFRPSGYYDVGDHLVLVEVQNAVGLWSNPGRTTFTVTTPQTDAPVLRVENDGPDARLSWSLTTATATTAMYLYRDDVLIAKLSGPLSGSAEGTYTDRFVLGTHRWTAVREYENNAILSDSVTLTLRSCVTRIAAFSGGPWIELKLSENAQRMEAFTQSRGVSLRHVTGTAYPVAEIGPYLDGSGSYDAAFQTVQELAAFEALFGQPVIVKSRGGQVMVGVLSNLRKSMGEFYISASFTLSRIYWRDYLDVSDN